MESDFASFSKSSPLTADQPMQAAYLASFLRRIQSTQTTKTYDRLLRSLSILMATTSLRNSILGFFPLILSFYSFLLEPLVLRLPLEEHILFAVILFTISIPGNRSFCAQPLLLGNKATFHAVVEKLESLIGLDNLLENKVLLSVSNISVYLVIKMHQLILGTAFLFCRFKKRAQI